MMSINAIQLVQRSYPAIYLACHADRVRTRSNPYHLSAHDPSPLAHLDEDHPVAAGELARHLGIVSSTLPAALARLETHGHVTRIPHSRDRRKIELRLTPLGAKAVNGTSVFDQRRVAAVLAELPAAKQRKAVQGIVLLAKAARRYQAKAPRRKKW